MTLRDGNEMASVNLLSMAAMEDAVKDADTIPMTAVLSIGEQVLPSEEFPYRSGYVLSIGERVLP